MNQIANPSADKIMLLLVPLAAAWIWSLAAQSINIWMILIAAASVSAYVATLTYFCIKQNCRKQLAVSIVKLVIILGSIYMIQFGVRI